MVQVRFVEPVPSAFAVIIGDAVHNLRCALDHMMWELIGRDGGTQNKHLQFPCRESKVDFEGACKGIQTPSDWIRRLLASFECYIGGKGEVLYVIHMLDVSDKHRIIGPVLRATSHPPMRMFNAEGKLMTLIVGNLLIGGWGDTGSVGLISVPPGGSVELEEDASCAPSIFMHEVSPSSGDAFEVLGTFARAVRIVIDLTEAEIAKHPKE